MNSGTLSSKPAILLLLVFTVIPHVGSGYTGLMFALSPVFTLALSSLFGLRAPGVLGIVRIGFGLAGAAIVTLTRQPGGEVSQTPWVFVALLIPVTLACGIRGRAIQPGDLDRRRRNRNRKSQSRFWPNAEVGCSKHLAPRFRVTVGASLPNAMSPWHAISRN